MKNTTLALLFLLPIALMLSAGTAIADPSDILGRYWLPDRDGQFEMLVENGRYFGRVTAYDVPDQLDEENADPKLRTRPFVGIRMFEGFRWDGDQKRWVDGTIYDAKSGKTYSSYIWLENDAGDEGGPSLVARGFIGLSLFGRNERFERVMP